MYFFNTFFSLTILVIDIFDKHEATFRFKVRTSSLCVITEGQFDSIAGHQNDAGEEDCKLQCEKYEWCRGVRVMYSNKKECRLLTNNSTPIDGYNYLNPGRWVEPKDWKESILYPTTVNPTYRCLEKIEIRCKSQIAEGKCELIGTECWCYKGNRGNATSSVCGYPNGYQGIYYSLSTNSSHSPWKIIETLGQVTHPTLCKENNTLGCQGNPRRNVCHDEGCTGTSLTASTDHVRWENTHSAIVRCVDLENDLHECGRAISNGNTNFWNTFTRERVVSKCPTDKPLRFKCGHSNGPKYISRIVSPINLMFTECIKFESGSLYRNDSSNDYIIHIDSSNPSCISTNQGSHDLYLSFTKEFHCAGQPNVEKLSGWWFSVSYFEGCFSRVSDGKCSLIGFECWCYFPPNYSGLDVCGYSTGYEGNYYSLARNSSHSPWTIIHGLGKKNHPNLCKEDTCVADHATNICDVNGCTGTSLTSWNDTERWKRNTTGNTSYRGGIVRCVNMEDNETSVTNDNTVTGSSATLSFDVNTSLDSSASTKSTVSTSSKEGEQTSGDKDTTKRGTSPNLDRNTMTTLPEKTSSDDTTNNKIKSSNSGMIIGIVAGSLAALAFCVINIIICRRKKKSNETKEFHGNKDAFNQNDEPLDDAYDSAYVNLQKESKKQTKTGNGDVMENPYYETDFNLEEETSQKKTTAAVNLEETEVVIAKENIYYDI